MTGLMQVNLFLNDQDPTDILRDGIEVDVLYHRYQGALELAMKQPGQRILRNTYTRGVYVYIVSAAETDSQAFSAYKTLR